MKSPRSANASSHKPVKPEALAADRELPASRMKCALGIKTQPSRFWIDTNSACLTGAGEAAERLQWASIFAEERIG